MVDEGPDVWGAGAEGRSLTPHQGPWKRQGDAGWAVCEAWWLSGVAALVWQAVLSNLMIPARLVPLHLPCPVGWGLRWILTRLLSVVWMTFCVSNPLFRKVFFDVAGQIISAENSRPVSRTGRKRNLLYSVRTGLNPWKSAL